MNQPSLRVGIPEATPPPGMALDGRPVAIFGMARSGIAMAEFLVDKGAVVTVFDEAPPDRIAAALARLDTLPVNTVPSVTDYAQLGDPEFVFISPAVPVQHPLLQTARNVGATVIGEVELAYRFCPAPIIAITGTNGKGTTVTLLGDMLKAADISTVVGGNIGVPLISLIDDMQASQVVVAEISSFQLETVEQFKPWIGILLNISPDHRDRHPDLQEYISTKSLLFANQSCGDIAILNADDRHVAAVSTHPAVEVLRVSLSDSTADGKLDGQTLTIQLRGHNPVQLCHANEFAISGSHHQRNTLCASLAAAVCGARPEAITRAIRDYSPPRHLMEDAGTVNGVRFVNDSKATNPAAAMADWASIRGAVVLIAGGRSKEADLRQFAASAASRAKHIVLIGESAQSLSEAVGCQTPVTVAISMSQAVQAAFDAAEPGDTVLMAPGCASHDMFENMAARGEAFCREVTELARRFSF